MPTDGDFAGLNLSVHRLRYRRPHVLTVAWPNDRYAGVYGLRHDVWRHIRDVWFFKMRAIYARNKIQMRAFGVDVRSCPFSAGPTLDRLSLKPRRKFASRTLLSMWGREVPRLWPIVRLKKQNVS